MERPGEKLEYDFLLFGERMPRPILVQDAATPEEALAATAPAPCAFLYRSLDCNLGHSNGCEDVTAGRTTSEELVFARHPYNNVLERGVIVPIVRLALYELDPANENGPAPVTRSAP